MLYNPYREVVRIFIIAGCVMEKSREAMLKDFEKPKVLADNTSLEPDWLTKKNKNWEKQETWWDKNHKARSERNFSGTLVNIFFILLLLTYILQHRSLEFFISPLLTYIL